MIAPKGSLSNGSVPGHHYDVVVVGGGPAGLGAAIAAGRMGAKVAVVERHDVLGGMGTAALVNNFCPAHLDGHRLIIGGVFAELRERLIVRKAIFAAPRFEYKMEPYHPVAFAEEAEEMARAAGVEIWFRRSIGDVDCGTAGPSTLTTVSGDPVICMIPSRP